MNLLFDIASVLRYEIDALRENHASLIQITEPIGIVRDIDVFLDLLSGTFQKGENARLSLRRKREQSLSKAVRSENCCHFL